MKDVTTLGLGWNAWVVGILGGLSALLTGPLLRAAGIGMPQDWAQWLVFFLCQFTIWRGLAFVAWLALVLIAPNSKLLGPVKR